MSFIRPQIRKAAHRWREVIAALATAAAGLWLLTRGGWLLGGVGFVAMAFALGWAVIALRRLRFLRETASPGVVEVDEGQVGYYGPSFGGFVALSELTEIRLILHGERRQWRLRTRANEVLSIPVDAAGADRLYDAFAALPGIDMATLVAAIDRGAGTAPLWRRDPQPRLLSGHDETS